MALNPAHWQRIAAENQALSTLNDELEKRVMHSEQENQENILNSIETHRAAKQLREAMSKKNKECKRVDKAQNAQLAKYRRRFMSSERGKMEAECEVASQGRTIVSLKKQASSFMEDISRLSSEMKTGEEEISRLRKLLEEADMRYANERNAWNKREEEIRAKNAGVLAQMHAKMGGLLFLPPSCTLMRCANARFFEQSSKKGRTEQRFWKANWRQSKDNS